MSALTGSVGQSGDNNPADVVLVKQELSVRGFDFFPLNSVVDAGLIQAIRLFQSIIFGRNSVGGVDGRIDSGGTTWNVLISDISPRWQLMPTDGAGFVNFERQDMADHHDYGTSWLATTIVAAGSQYQQAYLGPHPNACVLTVNDVSLPSGGDTPSHKGHETGLACDIRLPRIDGGSGGISNPNTNSAYDRNAMRAQLLALRAQPLFSRAFFNDKQLIAEGLCNHLAGHNNHLHFEIKSALTN